MTGYRIFSPSMITALLLAPAFTMGANGADDLPLSDEIQRRFGEDASAAEDQFEPLEQFALKFTQSINCRGEIGEVVVDERSFVWRPRHVFFQGRVVSRPRPRLVEEAHLEDDVEPAPREPTVVENQIAEGFPAGIGESVVEDVPPSNHIVVYSNAFAFCGVRFSR